MRSFCYSYFYQTGTAYSSIPATSTSLFANAVVFLFHKTLIFAGACLPILRIGSGIFVVPFWVGTEIVVIGKQDYFILELQI